MTEWGDRPIRSLRDAPRRAVRPSAGRLVVEGVVLVATLAMVYLLIVVVAASVGALPGGV